jgi:hypothetical protein
MGCGLTSEAFQIFARELESEKKIDREDLRFFLSRILDACNRLHRSGRRGLVVIAGLAGLFVLMSAGGLTEAELFGVKVSRFSLFLIVIPVAVAFIFARSIIMIKSSTIYKHIYFDITGRYYPSWARSRLDGLLLTSEHMLSGAVDENFFDKGLGRQVLLASSMVEMVAWTFAPLAFDVYAYLVLFRSSEIQQVGVTISAAISGLLIILGMVNFLTMPTMPETKA